MPQISGLKIFQIATLYRIVIFCLPKCYWILEWWLLWIKCSFCDNTLIGTPKVDRCVTLTVLLREITHIIHNYYNSYFYYIHVFIFRAVYFTQNYTYYTIVRRENDVSAITMTNFTRYSYKYLYAATKRNTLCLYICISSTTITFATILNILLHIPFQIISRK